MIPDQTQGIRCCQPPNRSGAVDGIYDNPVRLHDKTGGVDKTLLFMEERPAQLAEFIRIESIGHRKSQAVLFNHFASIIDCIRGCADDLDAFSMKRINAGLEIS